MRPRPEDKGKPPLDEVADRLAEAPEQSRDKKEADATRDHCADREGQKIEVERAARNGDEFERYGRGTLDDDQPGSPALVEALKRMELIGHPVKAEERLADRIERVVADRIPEKPAEHRGHRADRGEAPRLAAVGQNHRNKEHVGRNRKERALDEAHRRKRPDRVTRPRKRNCPVVEPA